MKGGGVGVSSSYSLPAKRRWKCFVIAVLGLVFLSMLVPLVFLLGLHNGFHSSTGYVSEQRNSASNHFPVYDQRNAAHSRKDSKVNQSTLTEDLIRRFAPTLPENLGNVSIDEVHNDANGNSMPENLPKEEVKKNSRSLVKAKPEENKIGADESEMICELKFGSYCLWRQQQRGEMEDSVVKRMKDLLYVARAYYPSIAKLSNFDKLSHQLKQNIQDFERVLSEATTDKDRPPGYEQKMMMMEAVIRKAKSCPVDCNNVDKKFRQLVDLTEDESNFHMKQSAFLYKVAVQTMPKSLHCLSMRLTFEYFKSSSIEQDLVKKFRDPDLYHYVIFSRNILASSVVINSTVLHAKESAKLVFHLLTDRENYFAMKFWFFNIKYGDAAVQVLNIEDSKLYNHHMVGQLYLSLPEEFRVSFHRLDNIASSQFRTKYLSIFSHAHYLLPYIFQSFGKVVVLDDDVIVQRDLSALWDLDMGGKINGAVQYCAVKLFHLESNLAGSSVEGNSCAWTSGLNVIDMSRWRVHNLTEAYQRLVQQMSKHGLSETATLRAGLLTFQGLVYALEDSWMLSGLGHNYSVDAKAIKSAAVLHFDGSMKPWLEISIPKYRRIWRKFLDPQNQFLNDCNVNQ
ncbi:probable galacturonosyltransferase 7 isoform X2 [Andrographis paniculata]|uniref:probable galacturonosyltransferase 7 isoform X2 n=1 Tax=Andrographis paniculata TaxID=175694 RepID=UPI0021E8F9F5|nr:probable galacturonosyltransferase 7 isoform X2 [Andrographis paniculata]